MSQGRIVFAIALLLAPAMAWAGPPHIHGVGHCASCGVEAPACGCDDVVHCSRCAPRCNCVCLPPVIPNLLRGVDRILTGLFTCHCRPACGPCASTGCVDSCGCGDSHGYEMGHEVHEVHRGPTPATDAMSNPFQDDPIQPSARYRPRTRSPYRMGRVTQAPSRRPQQHVAAAPPAPSRSRAQAAQRGSQIAASRQSTQVAQVANNEPVAAAAKPRIVKVEYAKPSVTRQSRPASPAPSDPGAKAAAGGSIRHSRQPTALKSSAALNGREAPRAVQFYGRN